MAALQPISRTAFTIPFVFRAGLRPALNAPALALNKATTTPQNRHATSSSLGKTTQPPTSRRRSVTVTNDTGAVPWHQLSTSEKAARTTQQSFNFGLIVLGIVMTGGVATVLYLEVFSTDSKTAIFNRSADQIRGDAACRSLLCGDEGLHRKRDISAFGEPSWSRWARNRTVASRVEKDRVGVEHLHMHFYVEGTTDRGTVHVEMARRGNEDWEYRMLALDVTGKQRHYVIGGNDVGGLKSKGKMFGVRWN
ncbi:hypothetical protein MBLNU230_g5605t1 [Neophaeotheca triangularis]